MTEDKNWHWPKKKKTRNRIPLGIKSWHHPGMVDKAAVLISKLSTIIYLTSNKIKRDCKFIQSKKVIKGVHDLEDQN